MEFTWLHNSEGNVSVNLTQQSFVEMLLENFGFTSENQTAFTTPYQSGILIHTIPTQSMSSVDMDKLRLQYQSLVGSLNWLPHTTRPDLSTVISLLAQNQSNPSIGHLDAAFYVVNYLSHTKTFGIYFSSSRHSTLESFIHFPVLPRIISMSDANWGPQDATMTKTSM